MTFTAIAYDVADDNRRAKVARLLYGVANRVQKSVFEGYLDEATFERVVRKLANLLDPQTDSVRLYRLCKTCRNQITVLGRGRVEKPKDVFIV